LLSGHNEIDLAGSTETYVYRAHYRNAPPKWTSIMTQCRQERSRIGWIDKLMLSQSKSFHVDGLWIGSFRTPSDLSRVEDALLLIKQISPLQYARVIRNLARIWAFVLPNAKAEYRQSLNACMLDERYVSESIIERLASSIIHEATHAMLERLGISYEQKLRSGIETVCFRRELAFAAKLPNGTELRKELLRKVEWYGSNEEWFSDVNFRERQNQGNVEALRHLKTPDWLIRTILNVNASLSKLGRLFRLADLHS
jgi:hypothetical protein